MILTLLISISLHAEPRLADLKLPAGFKIQNYAYPVEGARSLVQGPNGIVFVGTRQNGAVYALLPDKNSDGKSDQTVKLATGLNQPNGVAFKDGNLYVAEINRILIFKDIEKNLKAGAKFEPWGPEFPSETHHGWKFIAFGPDGWLYVPVGAPCNVCDEDPSKFAAIHKISPDGKTRELVARGVRNTVGFDWHPTTKELWFTDNGRDWMGDDIPPCELNRLSKPQQHFGFPYCHGNDILDPEFGKGKSCAESTKPEHLFGAHSAPLGMRFMTRSKELKNSILVALHGSWNRSSAVGYEVQKINLDAQGKVTGSEKFVTGFLRKPRAWGRPVDVLELSDGSVLLSDDGAGAVYRISR